MKTVKDVSQITGVSIRTLRYYDEINLLKPTRLTEKGYRLYDNEALARLQEIMFFRELEIPLSDIKRIMENPKYNREQALFAQKSLLERKRNRLNGIIELIDNVRKGADIMNFEAFNDEDASKIAEHSLSIMNEEAKEAIIKEYGSVEAFLTLIKENLKEEGMSAHLIKMYGSKDKAMEAALQSGGNQDCFKEQQSQIDRIYKQFALFMKEENPDLAQTAVERLAECYKEMFRLDSARFMLLELAQEYGKENDLTKATDEQYGAGAAKYIGEAIRYYYGA